MLHEILIGGFGGQGVMLMGKLLAYGAIYEGLEVTFFPSYGPEMRGGTANCTVVISDQMVGSPIKDKFSALMAMNQASLDKFTDQVVAGGFIVYNKTMVDVPPIRSDLKVAGIPATQIAMDLGNPQAANMVAVGGLIGALGFISYDSIKKGIKKVLPEYRHHLIPLNEEAVKKGLDKVLKELKMEKVQ